ncbi:hypothetical protein DSM112329_02105 [Paraconexibacter sp. AEG42_29]|uniref:AB hydrolase-1 domain-containing protein n=1 Tax=Paraconexibacter sp. AEG42_29 TaxID=2997339 RepID=A0AAU7AUD1_9ACTN
MSHLSPRRTGLALVLLTLAVAPSAASAATTAPAVSLRGATAAEPLKVCGASRSAASTTVGAPLKAVVRAGRTKAIRRTRLGSTLTIDQCVAGAWKRLGTTKVGARRTALVKSLSTAGATDLRLRTKLRTGRTGKAAYVRVGVGELVDVPVSFKVVNQNRTPVPCLGGPDGKTYEVRGTFVGPRAALDSGDAATLYVHGVGYSSFFFRFGEVPGYDYGRQQAEAGHASIFVTRLGNPSDPGLSDGNATCVPAQADMADQMIGRMRAGDYTLGSGTGRAFKKVGLAGHSLGGMITQVAQYSFKSADAIAVISYTDTPSPLALTQFADANAACFTTPGKAGPGDAGPVNYAAFGRTDGDFAGAHFFNIDPAVAAATLRLHNRDACGDLTSATGALLANQLLIRSITAPVLLIGGSNDALFPPPTNLLAATTGFPSSKSVKLVEIPDTGHAITLGRTHLAFRAAMGDWLTSQGL